MVTFTSQEQQNTNLSQTLHSNNSELHSFPTYLTNKEPPFLALNLPEPTRIRTLTPIITNNRTSTEDDEIGVFRAEKYFNEAIAADDDGDDGDETQSRVSTITSATRSVYDCRDVAAGIRSTSLNLEQIRARIQPRTPSSFRSETSWNSRSVLLRVDGQQTVNASTTAKSGSSRNARFNGRKLLASFACICSDKQSVRTKEIGEISFSNNHTNNNTSDDKSSCFSNSTYYRPNLNFNDTINVEPIRVHKPPKADVSVIGASFRAAEEANGPIFRQCKSPEVFGSSPALKTMSLGRRLTMMQWDRPRKEVAEIVSGGGGINMNIINKNHHPDSGSDASSDLFEIDSLTGKTGVCLGGGRRASDDLTVTTTASGCVTPTTGYAPSEASIQWSVVTASAADYASVVSDCDEAAYRRRSPPSAAAARELARRRRALLGCKSQKAVSVARTSPRPGYDPGSIQFPADSPARFQAEIARIDQRMAHLASPSPRNNSRLLFH